MAAYEAARIPRTSRVQAFASENSAIAAIRNAARPADVTEKERPARFAEFLEWLAQYPNNLAGDPSSTYWRPL